MHTNSQNPQLDSLPPETIQAFLDALAALSLRHGIVVDSGSHAPMHPDVGGYLLATGGYLHTYAPGEQLVRRVVANLYDALCQTPSATFVADFAGMTAHERMRSLRGLP